MNKKISLLLGFAITLSLSHAFAGGLEFTGNYRTVDPSKQVVLKDEKGRPIVLNDGLYKVHTSKKYKALYFENRNVFIKAVFKTGFPGDNFENFRLDGVQNGINVDVMGNTLAQVTRTWNERRTESCSINQGEDWCGRQIVGRGYEDYELQNQQIDRSFVINFTEVGTLGRNTLGQFQASRTDIESRTVWSSGCRISYYDTIGSCRTPGPIPPR
jgi:hypothetical protein